MDCAVEGTQKSNCVDRNLYRDVMGHFVSGVTVITARLEGTDYGLTASAVTSLSLDPPMLLVCVNKDTGTCNAIARAGAFAVNILREEQGEIAMQFARPDPDKFRGIKTSYGELGEPLLTDVLAHLECRVTEEVSGGTHSVFLAEVQNADARAGMPLAYFRGKFGRFADPADGWVYSQIRKQVLDRDLPLGRALDVTELAYQIDAPRQSVHYALAKLSAEGLVSRDSESGYIGSGRPSRIYVTKRRGSEPEGGKREPSTASRPTSLRMNGEKIGDL